MGKIDNNMEATIVRYYGMLGLYAYKKPFCQVPGDNCGDRDAH